MTLFTRLIGPRVYFQHFSMWRKIVQSKRPGTPKGKELTGWLGQKPLKAQKLEYISTIDSRGHALRDRRLWVKSLREKVQEGSLKLMNPKTLKKIIIADLWEETCRQIKNPG
jgi:hypothetical protein